MKPLQQINEILSMHKSGKVNSDDAITLLSEAAKSKGQRAYELRKQGMQWKKIGKMVGLVSPFVHAEDYAMKSNLPWPLKKRYVFSEDRTFSGKESYEMRSRGLSWADIGRKLGVSRQAAHQSSYQHARRNNLPQHRACHPELGGVYYRLRETTALTWGQIAEQHGKSQPNVYISASRYASKNNLPWPI